MGPLADRLGAGLALRRQDNLFRRRLTLQSAQGPVVQMDGREYLNFCSNDYLGLAAHPRVVEAFQRAAASYGVGSGASHLVCGHSTPHHQLEEALAEFTGRPRALLFSSGYMANMGILTTLLRRGDHVFEDRLNHASLLDGGLHSGARFQRFGHSDVAALERKLAPVEGVKLVVVDGVFSMDGDTAPLQELVATCSRHDASLMVDDAHGFGVMGKRGAGSTEAAGLDATSVPVLMATLGKALGTAGAFVAGSELLDRVAAATGANLYLHHSPAAGGGRRQPGIPAPAGGGILAPGASQAAYSPVSPGRGATGPAAYVLGQCDTAPGGGGRPQGPGFE